MSVPLKDNMCTAELQFIASKECIDMLITMSMTKILNHHWNYNVCTEYPAMAIRFPNHL